MPYGIRDPVPLTHYRPDIPYEVPKIIEKALSEDPRIRYQDPLEFAFDIEQISISTRSHQFPDIPLRIRDPTTFWK